MTKLNKFLLVAAIIAIAAAFTKFVIIFPHHPSQVYSLQVIKLPNGWGYDILKYNKPYIHQTIIPAVEGVMPFPDENSARRTGMLVLEKIHENKSPRITEKEIDSLRIKIHY